MSIQIATGWATALLLLTLRMGPMFIIAPPFSQFQVPMRVRVAITLALAACFTPGVAGNTLIALSDGALFAAAGSELLLGLALAFAFQAASASLMFAGRVLDVQAGYGLAMVVDPGSRAQSPLFGTIFTLVAGVIFLSSGGTRALLELFASLARLLPPGQIHPFIQPESLIAWFGITMALGLLSIGASILCLFLIDVTIAFLSRTLPQMNALMLGLQFKAVAAVIVTAMSIGLLAPAALQLFNRAVGFVPSLS